MAAILVLFLTVVAGMVVLGLWAEPVRTKTDRKSLLLAGVHIAGALAAVTLWLVFAVGRSAVVGWVGLAVLTTTILLGVSTLVSSRVAEQPEPADGTPRPVATAALVVHGGFAMLAAAFAVAAIVGR